MKQAQQFDPDSFLQQSQNAPTAFIDFNRKVNANGKDWYFCFVEGKEDHHYYFYQIKKRYNISNTTEIICGNKKSVIDIQSLIKNKPAYANFHILYFIDKDYDNNANISEDIFITDGYSVENYFCSNQFLRKFLINVVGETDSSIIEILIKQFAGLKNDFVCATKPFCSWLKAAHNIPMSKDAKDKHKKSFPLEYAEFKWNKIIGKNYNFNTLNTDYNLTIPVTKTNYDLAVQSISDINDIRGKFVIQLIETYIDGLKTNVGKKTCILKRKFQFELNRKTLIQRLSPYADDSERLKQYLDTKIS